MVLFTGLALFILPVFLQAQPHILVPASLEVYQGDLSDVSVKITKEGKIAFTQSGASAMQFRLELNRNYTLKFTKAGHITRTISFDSHVPAARIAKGFDPFPMDVKLFPVHIDDAAPPVQSADEVRFDVKLNDFNFISKSHGTGQGSGKRPGYISAIRMGVPAQPVVPSNPGMAGSGTWQPIGEKIKITRDDTHEQRKIVTTIRVIRDGVSVEYRRVSHEWGGIFYFRNGTTSIPENLFMQWTGMRF